MAKYLSIWAKIGLTDILRQKVLNHDVLIEKVKNLLYKRYSGDSSYVK